MHEVVAVVFGHPLTLIEAIGVAVFAFAGLLIWLVMQNARAIQARAIEAAQATERQRELDDKVEAMNRLQAEMTGRMQTMAEVFGSRQADLARLMADRLDSVRTSMSNTLTETANKSNEHLGKLNERLAVIDAAQANLKGLTSEVLSLKDVLSNKQARGAYGQGRMEAIVRDALPAHAYTFQMTLKNRSRPDCAIHLPGGERPLVIDAKFPLEGFVAFREATNDDARLAAQRRVRNDLNLHIKDVAEKYLVPGETQDIAMLFVPSEAIYADLSEHFEDVVQKSHRARVLIVSPSILMMAIQVAQSIVRDAAVREQARIIQTELGKLLDDVRRLNDRASKLGAHFKQAQDDVLGIVTSAEKINTRGTRMETLDFGGSETQAVSAPPSASEEDLPALPLRRNLM